MWSVPWWAVVSSVAAPVVLITGTAVAADRQPDGYDLERQTLSTLASDGATDRWVMTLTVIGLGVAHLITSLGLRAAALAGRTMLGIGGGFTALVSAFPQGDGHGRPSHAVVAGVAFGSFALWPVLAARRRRFGDGGPARRGWLDGAPSCPWPLRPRVGTTASIVSLGLVGWFAYELTTGPRPGLAETTAVGALTLWPLAVVLGVRATRTRSVDQAPAAGPPGELAPRSQT